MKQRTGLLFAGLILAVLAAVFLPARGRHTPPPAPALSGNAAAPGRPGVAGSAARDAAAHPEIGFRSRERLVEHFRKHGRDFGSADARAYLRIAQALRDRPAVGNLLEAVRSDGVVTRFDRENGAFIAFGPDLVIRTCFKPNDGEAYFRRQLARAPGGGRRE